MTAASVRHKSRPRTGVGRRERTDGRTDGRHRALKGPCSIVRAATGSSRATSASVSPSPVLMSPDNALERVRRQGGNGDRRDRSTAKPVAVSDVCTLARSTRLWRDPPARLRPFGAASCVSFCSVNTRGTPPGRRAPNGAIAWYASGTTAPCRRGAARPRIARGRRPSRLPARQSLLTTPPSWVLGPHGSSKRRPSDRALRRRRTTPSRRVRRPQSSQSTFPS